MRKKFFGLILFLIGVLMCAAVSAALPVTVDKVKVEGAELTPGSVNKLDVERGQKIDVSVTVTALEDIKDVQVEAFISGYEHGTISDSAYFDATVNTTYVKHFTLTLPDRVEKDDYVLRVMVTARQSADEKINDYKLKISSPRHAIAIKDVIFRPDTEVEAGRAVVAVVRVKNMGDKDEEGIKITASIPKLKVSDSDYIDELKEGETTSSEELWLKIADPCAETGSYDVTVTASYQDGDEETSDTYQLNVAKSDACKALPSTEEVSVVGLSEAQDITKEGAGVIYPITITNSGASTRTFTLQVSGADWADYKVSPSQVISVDGGETLTASVYVAAKESAAVGEQMFAVSVKDSSGKAIEELTMKANVEEAAGRVELGGVRRGLEIALIALIVLLVIVGLIVAFTRLRGGPEEETGQTYY